MNNLGLNIRKVRELRGYSQEFLAEKLKISQSAYAKYEKENSTISVKRLEQIAKELDVKIDELLTDNKNVVYNFNNNKISSVSHIIENLNTENIETLQDFITFLKQENNLLKTKLEKFEKKFEL